MHNAVEALLACECLCLCVCEYACARVQNLCWKLRFSEFFGGGFCYQLGWHSWIPCSPHLTRTPFVRRWALSEWPTAAGASVTTTVTNTVCLRHEASITLIWHPNKPIKSNAAMQKRNLFDHRFLVHHFLCRLYWISACVNAHTNTYTFMHACKHPVHIHILFPKILKENILKAERPVRSSRTFGFGGFQHSLVIWPPSDQQTLIFAA